MFGLEKYLPKKKETPQEEVNEEVIELTPETFKKKTKTLEKTIEAQEEIETLKEKRKEKLIEYREKKDEIKKVGVAEFEDEKRPVKRTETFNELLNDTEKELAEISQKVEDIREEFDMQPSHVQRLEDRRERVREYIESIKQKMAPEYREVKGKITNFFGDLENVKNNAKRDGKQTTYFLDAIKDSNVPEVKSFFIKIQGLNPYENGEKIADEIYNLVNEIESGIKEHTFYKTPAEEREAQIQIERGVRLDDEITKLLRDAKNKEGRFENKKGYF